MGNTLWFAVMFAMCGLAGWVGAHESIKNDCSALGGFYIGDTTYSCSIARYRP